MQNTSASSLLVSFFVTLLISSNSWAVEPVDDQQAILYYQVPFGAVKKSDDTHKFGFRLDRVTIERSGAQYQNSMTLNELIKKPASLDLQMGHNGIAAFKMHGYDYLPYIISKADGENNGDQEVIQDTENQGEVGETVKEEEKLLEFSDVVTQTSFGIMMGLTIGIIALTGSGG